MTGGTGGVPDESGHGEIPAARLRTGMLEISGLSTDKAIAPWGYYFPGKETRLLRLLIWLGLSRGFICKWIRRKWKSSCPVIVDRTIRGTRYRLHIKDNTTDGKLLTSSKFYDHREITALGTGNVFIDIGANTGYYSLTLAKAGFKTVIAVEPNPPTLELLRVNILLNGLDHLITVIPCCIGHGGDVPFYCAKGLGSASLIKPEGIAPPIFVRSRPLFDIVTEQDITRIDALKIDVEGYEDQALMPFFERAPESLWPKIIVIEDCHRFAWKKDVIARMLEIGYKIHSRTRGNSILVLV